MTRGPVIDESTLGETLSAAGVAEGAPVSETLRASAVVAWALPHALTQALERPGASPEQTLDAPPSRATISPLELPRITLAPAGKQVDGASGAPPADYEVLGVLAEGGMGRLLLARQRSLGREVVIKQARPDAATEVVLASLLAEARFAGALEHPSIVPVHALGRDADGRPLMVMKRIEGVPWSTLVERPDHPSWEKIAPGGRDRLRAHLEILLRVCDAVHFAHSRGVAHRDLKLDNVMVGYFGDVYVVDWGVALALRPGRSDQQGAIVGTPVYLAPEMLSGRESDVDERTDVYLLGATLHHALTGRPRHAGSTMIQVMMAAHRSEPADHGPEVPAELADLCNRATCADPARRPPSALALRDELASFLRHRGSIELTERMIVALDELAPTLADEAGRWAAHRRLIEARFGLEQALRDWPDNHRAAEALRRCQLLQLDHALAHGSLDEARALAAELGDPGPGPARRLADLEARRRSLESAREKLSIIERNQDLTVGVAQRRVIFGSLALLVTAAAVALNHLSLKMQDVSPRQLLVASLCGGVVVSTLMLAFRRRLAPGSLNHRIIWAFYSLFLVLLAQRVVGVLCDEPVARVVINGFPVALGGVAVGAVAVHRLFFLVGLVQGTCWLLVSRWPDQAAQVFPVAALISCLIMIAYWPGQARPEAPEKSA